MGVLSKVNGMCSARSIVCAQWCDQQGQWGVRIKVGGVCSSRSVVCAQQGLWCVLSKVSGVLSRVSGVLSKVSGVLSNVGGVLSKDSGVLSRVRCGHAHCVKESSGSGR